MSWLSMVGVALVWTGALALCAELLTRGRAGPHFAQTIWRGAALLMVLPWGVAGIAALWPGTVAALPIPEMPDLTFGGAGDAFAGVMPSQIKVRWTGPSIGTLIGGVLVIGWACRLIQACLAQLRLQRVKAQAKRSNLPASMTYAQKYASELGLATPRLVLSNNLETAFAAGLRVRTIYMPAAIVDAEARQLIIAHECVHIARGDLIIRPLERVVADLLWFSPFAWLVRRKLDYLREAVCDAETIKLTDARSAYAKALVTAARIAGPSRHLPVAAFILSRKRSLPMRVNAILSQNQIPVPRRMSLIALLAALLALPLAVAQGVSLQAETSNATFSHAVVDKGRITSSFGDRIHPITGERKWHSGVDIAGEAGSKIYAPAASTVIFSGTKGGYGNVVDLQVTPEVQLRFGQLREASVTVGQKLKAGDVIGLMGESGRATGVHLHFEVWKQNGSGDGILAHWDPEAEDIQLIADCECKDEHHKE